MVRQSIFSATRKDFRIDTFSSGGPGGQHQNKTQSGVRITHLESGISAECREHRSQPQNRKEAFRKLVKRLVAWVLASEERSTVRTTDVVRTYHEPDNRVKDHRTGVQQSWDATLDGHLDPFIEAHHGHER